MCINRYLLIYIKLKIYKSNKNYKGTVDLCKKFHPLCFMVTTHENATDYGSMFSRLKFAIFHNFDFEHVDFHIFLNLY